MASVERSRLADNDLYEIGLYIARDNPAAADALLVEIGQTSQRLAVFPDSGRKRDDLMRGLRSAPVGNYVIFYRPISGGIEVVRVLHGARDVEGIFEEDAR